ncbi:hypothetical protein CONCODRAFT_74510 [Conidiobolus coronatus NRRL 28638]|uniref:Uncharacterized protein n=1 Tax=Conidiobolus coronatus (strain ATCC 28846 / CBS 209.66 / NRRL 28638) TaxID=796925 RepID=A0A137NQH2_CONC2|nr:hypothetical protein CONCODRAFT_74510 [Conidiobolus coronatus NRRL 28638]|eukprot:KXN65007.1 hypothetical protein CONCODRAFT_74510 [Conidiobolus coronatus NRRL 28638]
MKPIAYTLLLTNFYQSHPTSVPQPETQFNMPQMSGIPLTRFPVPIDGHLGNNNLVTIAQTDNNILEGNGTPFVDYNYGIFIENLGDFYKFNNKDNKAEKRLEEMVEEGRVKENESTNDTQMENNNNIQPDTATESLSDSNIDQTAPSTSTSTNDD